MKLQHKLALYNMFTKMAIVAVMGLLIVIFVDKISVNHLKQRLVDKRNKFVSALSEDEINSLLEEASFTDYNILREEYIILTETGPAAVPPPAHFETETREIEGQQREYLIIEDQFNFEGRSFLLEIGETMEAVKQLQDTIYYSTLLVLFLSVIFTFFVDLAFTRVLLSPFYKIIDRKINKVNDPVHYNYEPVRTSTKDFRLLDRSIGELMTKIATLFMTEKQFISNISHELLTPISVLRSRLENMLNDEHLSGDSQARLIASLKTLVRMKAVVNSLLLISRIDNNQFAKNERIDLPALINETLEELEDRIRSKAIRLSVTLNEGFVFEGNQSLISTLLTNLINNAIKYNVENGSLNITGEHTRAAYRLVIADSGIGMNEEQIDKAFNRFEKFSEGDSDSHGLGLAIVKSIAAFHNMAISLKSAAGEGTKVILEIR
jgi:signal transduction histidine kinase